MPPVYHFFPSRSALRSMFSGRFTCHVCHLNKGSSHQEHQEDPDDIPEVYVTSTEPLWIFKLMSDVELNGEKIDSAYMEVESVGEIILQAGKRRFSRVIST